VLPIIAVDRNAAKALHRQIYEAYRTAIVDRTLRAGQRVPSTRTLAAELGISRIPVLNAYAQLVAEGYFESRVGFGTVICGSLPDQFPARKSGAVVSNRDSPGLRPVAARASLLDRFTRPVWLSGRGAFAVGQTAFDPFLKQVWSALMVRRGRNLETDTSQYGDPMGSKALREAIASYLRTARAVRCEADQIMIVSGSQQALDITTRVLLDRGSQVWMEEPGYRFAREVLVATGCSPVAIPVDQEGLDVSDGMKRAPKARAAYVTPSHQFPLGFTMSASRRLQLLDWAQKSGSWIIEDDYDSEFRYEIMPIASLQGLDHNARVLYIGTFSKVLFPSLRLGYVVIPWDLIDHFLVMRHAADISPPSFSQAVALDFIREGHFARHLRRMRTLYRERRSALARSVSEEFGSKAEVLGGEAGMHLTVTVQAPFGDVAVSARASREKLWLWPLSSCYFGSTSRQGFILGFGSTQIAEIAPAVRRLRKMLGH
jgi:GntR family transcriptional regulator/MocR family aminotransferase